MQTASRRQTPTGGTPQTSALDRGMRPDTAHRALEDLNGVDAQDDPITLSAPTPGQNARQRLSNAMHRNPQLDARHVMVTILDDTAILTGHVRTLAEKKQAGMATWACPEVAQVNNRLVIRPH